MAKDILRAIDSVDLPVINDMNDPNTPEGFAIAQAFNKLVYFSQYQLLLNNNKNKNYNQRLKLYN